jgi:hypothetical protein
VIPTDEELEIAEQTFDLVKNLVDPFPKPWFSKVFDRLIDPNSPSQSEVIFLIMLRAR